MLKRKILKSLIEWKKTRKRECLLVKGARQIGKTFIIREFGATMYSNFIEINFEKQPEFKDIFSASLKVDDILTQLSLKMPGVKFIPRETLIFFDEIQSCGAARTSLKFFAEDERFDVIASGSLLGINYKEVSSFPVGYERQIEMHALDFEEFLWANEIDENTILQVKKYFDNLEAIPSSMNDSMLKFMREYIVIGGMPAVVNKYIETKNFNDVQSEQDKITNLYMNDIAKYAPAADKPKARNCYLSVPKQLAKENKKFMYSQVSKGGASRKFANSLDWLRDANLIKFCYNVSTPTFPLKAYEKEDQFKIYMNDIGLLVSLYGYDMKDAIVNNTLKGFAKGGIYENFIADVLIKKNLELVYYKTENSSQEIEFLLNDKADIVPVEVKSGNSTTISLNEFLSKFDVPYGYKFISGNVGVVDKKRTLPLYMAMFLPENL